MIRCKDCMYFRQENHSFFADEFIAQDERGYAGVCMIMMSSNGFPDVPDTLAYASDAESYAASVKVKHDYGCVMGKTGEKQDDGT